MRSTSRELRGQGRDKDKGGAGAVSAARGPGRGGGGGGGGGAPDSGPKRGPDRKTRTVTASRLDSGNGLRPNDSDNPRCQPRRSADAARLLVLCLTGPDSDATSRCASRRPNPSRPGPRTGLRPSLLVLPCFHIMAQWRMRCFPVLRDVQELASFVPTALFAAGSGRCCPLLLRYLGPEPGGLRAFEVFLGPLGPARLGAGQ